MLYNLNSEQRIVLPRAISIGSETRQRPLTVRTATFSASPAPGAYLVAAIVIAAEVTVAFWQDFMAHWTTVGSPGRVDRSLGDLHDVIYYNGGFHFVTSTEAVLVFVGGQLVAMDRTYYNV